MLQGLLCAAAAPTGASAGAPISRVPRRIGLLVYDSRLPQRIALCGLDAERTIDVAQEHANYWRTLRAANPEGAVLGLTRWSDFVLALTLLQEKGLRLRTQARQSPLFYWEMRRSAPPMRNGISTTRALCSSKATLAEPVEFVCSTD